MVINRWFGLITATALALSGCQVTLPTQTVTPPPTPSAIRTAAATASPSPTHVSTTAPTRTASAFQLPNPGGTCLSSQFTQGTATSGYSLSTLFSQVVDVFQPLMNTGDACDLAVPKEIAMSGAGGPFVAIAVSNGGQQVCVKSACKTVYPASYIVPAGGTVWILLRAYWPWDPGAASPLPPACPQPITDVTRAAFPFASGAIEIDWDVAFHQVCATAAGIRIVVGKTPAG